MVAEIEDRYGAQIFTIHALISRAVRDFGSSVAVVDAEVQLTFEELYRRATQSAIKFRSLGIGRGDRVGICMGKTADQVVSILGVLLADAVIVPILPSLKSDNIRHIIHDSTMQLVITDEQRCREINECGSAVRVLDAAALAWEEQSSPTSGHGLLLARTKPALSECVGSDMAAIIYSSGSTGRPKGIMVSHRNLWDGAEIVTRYLGICSKDRIGSVLSLNFDYGLNQLWQALRSGATLFLHDLIFPTSFFDFVSRNQITVVPVMPAIITRIFDKRLLRKAPTNDLESVRLICTSGGQVSQVMIDRMKSTFPSADLVLMYGLTEAFRSTFLPPGELSGRPDSIGRAIPDVELLVVDEAGKTVPPGERGELVHRGGCVSMGYWNAPEATSERFRTMPQFPGERVVFTGDIVTRDAEGYFYFVGRRDNMIKTSGFRVSPTEVEEVAMRYPGVSACVAFGVQNIEIGADIVLAYTMDDITNAVDEAAFADFLRSHLPRHMVPKALRAMTVFPLTGNEGKVDRRSVQEAWMALYGGE